MKIIKSIFILCALAVAFSAVAQKRPPKGLNYALGDFNGDGKKEYVYFVPPEDADRWDELDDLDGLNGVLKFTDASIPDIFVERCVTGQPRNLGDLNGDGRDEIGIQPGWVTSVWQVYRVFTFKGGKWQDAIPSFTINLNYGDFDKNPPVKKVGKGKVRITTFAWENDDVVKKYKVVKVK